MEKLYTTRQIAEQYGVSVVTVNNWREMGAPVEGNEQRRGRYPTFMYNRTKLQKWLDEKYRRTPVRKP